MNEGSRLLKRNNVYEMFFYFILTVLETKLTTFDLCLELSNNWHKHIYISNIFYRPTFQIISYGCKRLFLIK